MLYERFVWLSKRREVVDGTLSVSTSLCRRGRHRFTADNAGPVRDLGDLYGRCYKRCGMFASEINELLSVANTPDITDTQEAWQGICAPGRKRCWVSSRCCHTSNKRDLVLFTIQLKVEITNSFNA